MSPIKLPNLLIVGQEKLHIGVVQYRIWYLVEVKLGIFFILLGSFILQAASIPLKESVLLGFERCKTLEVDLHKGQLRESKSSSFDLFCKRDLTNDLNFICDYFEIGSKKKWQSKTFFGGSDLGEVLLKNEEGDKIRFLLGKNFASYESVKPHTVCIGFYLFEKEALKKKM